MKKIIIAILFTAGYSSNAIAQEFEEIKPNNTNNTGNQQKPNNEREFEVDCSQDLEFDPDADVVFHMKSGKPFTGLCRTYYEDGSMEREIRFQNGKEDGEGLTLYKPAEDGKQIMMVRTNHNMGVPDGKWEFFYENGKRAWIQNYKEGLKEGDFIYYYEDGGLKKEEKYKQDLKEGMCKEYYAGNKVKSETEYKQGQMDGVYKFYFENGQVSYEGKFVRGIENGEINTYYEKGLMKTQSYFENGVKTGQWKTWYDDGKEKSTCTYVKGKLNGQMKTFYKDGQVKTIETWVEDKRTDIEAYDEFGNSLDPDEIKD